MIKPMLIKAFFTRALLASWVATTLLGAGCTARTAPDMKQQLPETTTAGQLIPAAEFEARFGIRVVLLAVTGGGGLVDLRFKITDGEKARLLLADKASAPVLVPTGSSLALTVSKKTSSSIRTAKNSLNILLYPNARHAVKPGSLVSVRFGAVGIEPIQAQ